MMLVYFSLLALPLLCKASLLASSEIQACKRTDSSFEPILDTGQSCSKKFVVALAVRNGQGESNHIYANMRYVSNNSGIHKKKEQLKKPFRISVTKSDVHINYPLRYLGSVNNSPREYWVNVYNWILGITSCNDRPLWQNNGDTTRASCGYQFDNSGNVVKYSEGYCCGADASEKLSQRWKYRRGAGYKQYHYEVHKYSQAVCMRQGPLWYNVFEIGDPFLTYQINVTIQQYDTVLVASDGSESELWRTIGYATVGPEKIGDNTANTQAGSTSTPMVKATWEGDFETTQSINQLNHKYLLVPDWNSFVAARSKYSVDEIKREQIQFDEGPEEWLIVDKHMVDMGGRVCNRLGVSYEGFKFQPNGCRQERYSCFLVTPRKIFEKAKVQKESQSDSPYFTTFYGDLLGPFHGQNITEVESIHHNTTFSLVYKSHHYQQSLVTLTFAADSVSFVENRSPARITETYIQDFEALGGAGQLYVLVQNIGTVSADYSVSVEDCSEGIIRVSDKHLTIDPYQQGDFVFKLSTSFNEEMNHTCHIVLYDNSGSQLDKEVVTFSTFRTCYCAQQCECECNGEIQTSASLFCEDHNLQNPFWTPDVVIREICTHCWFTDSLKSPFSLAVFILVCLLSLGMMKMLFMHICCRGKDGRPIDILGVLLGTANREHTKKKSRTSTIYFILGACFFVYLPLLPLVMLICNVRRRRLAKKRLKKKIERKRKKLMERKKKGLKQVKGLMVTKGLDETGVTLDEVMNAMDIADNPKKIAKLKKAKQKALVVSSSSDTSDNEFDYTSSEKEDTITKPRYMKKMKGGKNNNPALGKPSAFGGFMKDMEGAAQRHMKKEQTKFFSKAMQSGFGL